MQNWGRLLLQKQAELNKLKQDDWYKSILEAVLAQHQHGPHFVSLFVSEVFLQYLEIREDECAQNPCT